MSFGQMFFIKFVLYLPEWVGGHKNLYMYTCSTLVQCILSQDSVDIEMGQEKEKKTLDKGNIYRTMQ